MKKFLTVLLVIAVMFTFSFSTSFAAVDDSKMISYEEALAAVEKAYNDALATVKAEKEEALTAIFGTTGTEKDVKISAATGTVLKPAVDKVYTDVYDKAEAFVTKQYQTVLNQLSNSKTAVDASTIDKLEFYVVDVAEDISGTALATGTNAGGTKEAAVVAAKFAFNDATTGKEYASSTGLAAAYSDEFKTTEVASSTNAVAVETLKKVAADTIAAIAAIDENAYSAEPKGAAKSDREKVATEKASATNAVNAIVNASGKTWDGIFTSTSGDVDKIKAIYTPAEGQADPDGTLYDAIKGLTKVADLPTAEAKLNYAKNLVLAELTKGINDAKTAYIANQNAAIIAQQISSKPVQATIDTAKKNIADAEAYYAGALEMVNYLVADAEELKVLVSDTSLSVDKWVVSNTNWAFANNSTVDYTDDTLKLPRSVTTTPNPATYTVATVTSIVNKVADLKTEAELVKATIKIDGGTYIDVDDILADAIEATYYGSLTESISKSTEDSALLARVGKLLGVVATGYEDGTVINSVDTTVKINDRAYNNVRVWDESVTATNYEANKYAAVKKVVADTKAAINAAATIADADAAFLAGYALYDAIPTKLDRSTATTAKEFTDLVDKYKAEIKAYVDYKVAGLKATDTLKNYSISGDEGAAFTTLLKGKVDAASNTSLYGVEDLTAAYTAAKAEVDNLKTTAELKAAKDALDVRVKAVPTAPTVADKEAVKTLADDIDAHNKYCDLVGATVQRVVLTAAVTNATNTIKDAEAKAIDDAVKEIWKDGKVTTDEAAAVAAARTAYDAFVEYYSDPETIDLVEPTLTGTKDLDDAEAALWKAQVKAVEEMIAKLPADASDIAAIEAAQAAFDALSRGQKADVSTAMKDKLDDLAKVVDIATGVETLKLTAGSSAKKGSITVKWTVKGTGDRDGFQIWKSTKKNKGFKKAFTTTKTTYKNTKGLKAGTRYYYKVRAYKVVDGKNVYSDWSNKAIRIAK